MKRNFGKKFTLIELLAVMAIAAILLSMLIPAFSRLINGNQVDIAASNFKAGMEMAQTKAVSSRKYVAMIIPSPDKISSLASSIAVYAGGGYRLAYVVKNGNEYYFTGWVENSRWENPSDKGARLVKIVQNMPRRCKYKGESNKDTIKYIWEDFTQDTTSGCGLPSSAASATAQVTTVDATEGKYKSAGDLLTELNATANKVVVKKSDDTDLNQLSDLKNTALIFSPYGGMANSTESMGFVFTETKINGSTVAYPNKDNFQVLKLNGITGRVEYFRPEE